MLRTQEALVQSSSSQDAEGTSNTGDGADQRLPQNNSVYRMEVDVLVVFTRCGRYIRHEGTGQTNDNSVHRMKVEVLRPRASGFTW